MIPGTISICQTINRDTFYPINRGRVNLKLLPFPFPLSTQILPLCFSTNSLQSSNPRPVPFSSAVPVVEMTFDMSNSPKIRSGSIPTPLSETDIVIFPDISWAEILITPLQLVNFIAFEIRFRKIVFNISICKHDNIICRRRIYPYVL